MVEIECANINCYHNDYKRWAIKQCRLQKLCLTTCEKAEGSNTGALRSQYGCD